MATYNSSIITEAGIALIAKVTAGQVQDINITRVVTDDSDYSEVENLAALEQPLNLRHSFPVSKKEVVNEKTVFLRSVITNKDLDDAGYRITALGVMAQDPDKGEILYAVATAQEGKGDYFDAYNGYLPSTITVDFYIEVSNAAQVIINGGASGPATAEDLEKLAEELEKLKEAAEPLSGSGAPTTETVGAVGQHYIDTETNYVYICTKILPDGQYVWVQVNGGSSVGSAVVKEITIPAEGWALDETGSDEPYMGMDEYRYYVDVTDEEVTDDQVPIVALHKDALETAKQAGLCPTAQTVTGAVRFWARYEPMQDMAATLALLSASGSGQTGGGGTYVLPVATATTLGGVKLGEGFSTTPDGTLSYTGTGLPEDAFAQPDETQEMLDEVLPLA